MNGLELEQCIMQNNLVRRLYDGIYAVDTIRMPAFSPSYCIVNTDKASGAGKHWIVLFFPNSNLQTVEIFDSLAKSVIPRLLSNKLRNLNVANIIYNTSNRALQAPNTNTCGAHCLFYIYQKCKNALSLAVLLNEHYLNDTSYNDCMVLCKVSKNFILSRECMKKMLLTTDCELRIKN
jgi:hypothetical protein